MIVGVGGRSGGWFSSERPHQRIAAQAGAFAVSRATLLASTILVARVAGVTSYGEFALAVVVFQAGLLLRDAGLGQALIVVGPDTTATRAAFVATTAAGTALAAVVYLLAAQLTWLLGIPEAAGYLRILAVAFAVGSLGIASNASLERDLRFVARAAIDIASYAALGSTVAVLLIAGGGASALAWGYVAQGASQAVIAILIAPPWVGARGSGGVRSVARYGGLLWGAALLSYFAANLDNALVGRLGGSAELGIYALAYTIGNTITVGVAQVLNRVALPYYARARMDPVAARRVVLGVVPVSIALAGVPAIVIAATAPEIAGSLFGTARATIPIVLLAAYGVVRAAGIAAGTALNGIGLARVTVRAGAVNVVSMAVGVPLGFALIGLPGVALTVLISGMLASAYALVELASATDSARRGQSGELAFRPHDAGRSVRRTTAALVASLVLVVGVALSVDLVPLSVRLFACGCLVVVLLGGSARLAELRRLPIRFGIPGA